ncbi:MAG: GntR family transcriptional regulator [Lentisphaeria bacterium]|nr:GntR family transcriptional regulator [Lentisphaeria bacterium]
MRDKSKFRMIADQFRYLIRSGELISGEKFSTRRELCLKFGISSMTAFHVQEELQKDGLITNVPGVGFFVSYTEIKQLPQSGSGLRKIRMIGSPQAVGKDAVFGSAIVEGAREICEKNSIAFELELVQVLNNPAHIINTSRRLEEDEALMVMLHGELLPEVVNLLLSPNVRAVTVFRSFPFKAAVLTDMRDVAQSYIDWLKRRAARRVLYVGQASRWSIPQHETELFEFLSERASDFDFASDFSGNFRSVCEHIREFSPDAVVFSHSDAAVHLIENYDIPGLEKRPLISGFGHAVEQGKERLLDAVYYPDGKAMGRRAVEVLMLPDIAVRSPLWSKIKGNLTEFNNSKNQL